MYVRYRNNLIVQLVGNIGNHKAKQGRTSGHGVAKRLNKMPHFIAKAARTALCAAAMEAGKLRYFSVRLSEGNWACTQKIASKNTTRF